MLIRSQDRECMFVLETALAVFMEDDGFFDVEVTLPLPENSEEESTPFWWLGKYSTKEKALKVLDMIADWYRYNHGMVVSRGHIPDPVFQMPQDDEVEA